MNLSFLDDLFKGIGSGLADVDKFVDREMPFDSGWGAPAALVAAYFGAPYAMEALGSTGSAAGGSSAGGGGGMLSSLGGSGGSFGGELFQLGGSAGAEGSIGSGGMNSLLSSLGLEGGGSFAGQSAFQLPSSAYSPEYLNSLAQYQGVDAGNPSYLDNLFGNNEQSLYKQASSQSPADMLKRQAQQKALSQLGQGGSSMQQQGQQQQAEQNRMAQPQAMMRVGQPVDTTTALLSLLKEREQLKQPRISLI